MARSPRTARSRRAHAAIVGSLSSAVLVVVTRRARCTPRARRPRRRETGRGRVHDRVDDHRTDHDTGHDRHRRTVHADDRPVAAPATTAAETTVAAPAQTPAPEVSFCHRTDAVLHPYILLTVSCESIVQQGHGGHTGPVFPETGRTASGATSSHPSTTRAARITV